MIGIEEPFSAALSKIEAAPIPAAISLGLFVAIYVKYRNLRLASIVGFVSFGITLAVF